MVSASSCRSFILAASSGSRMLFPTATVTSEQQSMTSSTLAASQAPRGYTRPSFPQYRKIALVWARVISPSTSRAGVCPNGSFPASRISWISSRVHRWSSKAATPPMYSESRQASARQKAMSLYTIRSFFGAALARAALAGAAAAASPSGFGLELLRSLQTAPRLLAVALSLEMWAMVNWFSLAPRTLWPARISLLSPRTPRMATVSPTSSPCPGAVKVEALETALVILVTGTLGLAAFSLALASFSPFFPPLPAGASLAAALDPLLAAPASPSIRFPPLMSFSAIHISSSSKPVNFTFTGFAFRFFWVLTSTTVAGYQSSSYMALRRVRSAGMRVSNSSWSLRTFFARVALGGLAGSALPFLLLRGLYSPGSFHSGL
mmetsp:Transcript_1893/g.4272  ORF Transcript_1893/g.4272 Transcript_1893/m.4272 type:complete len:378 (+) Transcript_1893:417-1550(+)